LVSKGPGEPGSKMKQRAKQGRRSASFKVKKGGAVLSRSLKIKPLEGSPERAKKKALKQSDGTEGGEHGDKRKGVNKQWRQR